MSEEDAELLRLVREWRPADVLHPIAMQAWQLYVDGGHTLSEDGLEKLRGALDGHRDSLKSLGDAVEGLVRFSILLSDHQHDAVGAEKVVELIREYTPLFEPLWERIAEALANVGSTAPAADNPSSALDAFGKIARAEPLD